MSFEQIADVARRTVVGAGVAHQIAASFGLRLRSAVEHIRWAVVDLFEDDDLDHQVGGGQ